MGGLVPVNVRQKGSIPESVIWFGIIERGVPPRGGTATKCVRGRASGATVRSGRVFRVFLCSTIEARQIDTYTNRLGYVSHTYPARLHCVWRRFSRGTPPKGPGRIKNNTTY